MVRLRRAMTAAALVLVMVLALGGSIQASAPGTAAPIVYDALGDSYAAGYGVPPYSDCGRSQSAYPVRLDGRQHLRLDDFVACAGATTVSLVDGGQLAALDTATDLVTLTIGGNDIGWSTAVTACLSGPDARCTAATDAVTAAATGLFPALLDMLFAQVADAAPDADVVVTGYPHLFTPEAGGYLRASAAEQTALNAGADLLDATIESAATRARFRYVDVRDRFEDHGVNARTPWILGPLHRAAFHPTQEGYQAYAAAVSSALR